MVDRLEEKGLLARSADPDDGRRQLIHMTDSAVTLMPKLKGTARRAEGQFEAGVSAADLETFQTVLLHMLENVGEEAGAGFLHD